MTEDAEPEDRLERLEWRVDLLVRSLMSTQADVDALTATATQIAADLATTRTALQAEIDNLSVANPTLNLSALQSAMAPLDAAVQALAALKPDVVPTPPPPPPPPATPPPAPVTPPPPTTPPPA